MCWTHHPSARRQRTCTEILAARGCVGVRAWLRRQICLCCCLRISRISSDRPADSLPRRRLPGRTDQERTAGGEYRGTSTAIRPGHLKISKPPSDPRVAAPRGAGGRAGRRRRHLIEASIRSRIEFRSTEETATGRPGTTGAPPPGPVASTQQCKTRDRRPWRETANTNRHAARRSLAVRPTGQCRS